MPHTPDGVARAAHVPLRTCIATRHQAAASDLLRVTIDRDSGAVVPDPRRVLPGRGAWITPTMEAFEVALKRRAFERALRVSAPADTGRVREYLATLTGDSDVAGGPPS
ncbi:DUF448 domain-containing protein [Corynebacterium sp. 13CS0277]|uniref:YlxR family protein n=1 Tax=Corynebacterium sp. 13CS0277 TaxID=2071994 RepID=UPI000D0253BB|nr:YlxR family protein [Corynebacterium sp. 13CS0277]PRQ12615.1 DUF448 domain-containing protein [Corynebacterium sp. 13CS0277]